MQCLTFCVDKNNIHILADDGQESSYLEFESDMASRIYSYIRKKAVLDGGRSNLVVRIILPSDSFSHILPLVPLCKYFPTVAWSFVSLEDILLRYQDTDRVKALGHIWEQNGGLWQKIEDDSAVPMLSVLDVLALYTNQPKKTYSVYAKDSDQQLEIKDQRLLESTKMNLFAILLAAFPDVIKKISATEFSLVFGFVPPKTGSVFFQKSRGFIALQYQQYQQLEDSKKALVDRWANILIDTYTMKPIPKFSNIGQ